MQSQSGSCAPEISGDRRRPGPQASAHAGCGGDDPLRDAGKAWRLSDSLSGESFERSGDDMAANGLFISPDHWRF
jgi:hypothetical protein